MTCTPVRHRRRRRGGRRRGRRRLRVLRARAGLRVAVLDRGAGRRRHHRRRRGQPAGLRQGARPGTRPHAATRWRCGATRVDAGRRRSSWSPRAAWWSPPTAAGLDGLRGARRGRSGRPASSGRRRAGRPRRPTSRTCAPGLAGGAFYPQDMQVQPMLAAAHLLRAAARRPARASTRARRSPAIERDAAGRVAGGAHRRAAAIATPAVVNAAGTWAGEVAAPGRRADVPILPRRGFILVTEPLPPLVRHKVYAAEYVAERGQRRRRPADLGRGRGHPGRHRPHRSEPGAGRLRPHVRRCPCCAAWPPRRSRCSRSSPASRPSGRTGASARTRPDHLPVIGPDPRVPGLSHACGHEGAGIGLAPATGDLVAAALTGADARGRPRPRSARPASPRSDPP